MRDINYGFPALAHRASILKVKPTEIHESNLFDLSRALQDVYGSNYIEHPRLAKLMEKNDISDLGFMRGDKEAEAFDVNEFVKLHQSTLRRTDVISNLLDRTATGRLKTNATLPDKYGGYFSAAIWFISNHWFISIITIIGSIASIAAIIWAALSGGQIG